MKNKDDACKHRPPRLYSGTYKNEQGEDVTWVGCCDCGKIIGEGVIRSNK